MEEMLGARWWRLLAIVAGLGLSLLVATGCEPASTARDTETPESIPAQGAGLPGGGSDSGSNARATASPTPATSATPRATSFGCKGDVPRVCLVPLADYQAGVPAEVLAAHLEGLEHVELTVDVLPAVRLEVSDFDRSTLQLSANGALKRVEDTYRDLARDPDVSLMALTDRDMFVEGHDFPWAFGLSIGRSSIISTARMDPAFFGSPADPDLRDARLRKMASRFIGEYHLELPLNDSPLTLMYADMIGLSGLDVVREGIFDPAQLPPPSTAIEAWAVPFCSASQQYLSRVDQTQRRFDQAYAASEDLEDQRAAMSTIMARERDSPWQYLSDLDGAPIPAPDFPDETSGFHAHLRETVQWEARAVDAALEALADADTEGELFAIVVSHRYNSTQSGPWTALWEAYVDLPTETLGAMADVGRCGIFRPEQIPVEPAI